MADFYLPLTSRGHLVGWTVIDGDDATLAALSWGRRGKRSRYAGRGSPTTYLHRLIMGLSYGDRRQVDHIDGDGLNNRRSNLRIVTQAQNQQNTGQLGAHRLAGRKRWRAKAVLDGKQIHLGMFDTREAAEEAGREWRRLNFPFDTGRRGTDAKP